MARIIIIIIIIITSVLLNVPTMQVSLKHSVHIRFMGYNVKVREVSLFVTAYLQEYFTHNTHDLFCAEYHIPISSGSSIIVTPVNRVFVKRKLMCFSCIFSG
jgi:hypothetical protein